MEKETKEKYINALGGTELRSAIVVMQAIVELANLTNDPLHTAAKTLKVCDNQIDEACELFDYTYRDKWVFTFVLNNNGKLHLSSGIEVNIFNDKNECVEWFAYVLTSGYISDMEDKDAECFEYDITSDLYNLICM